MADKLLFLSHIHEEKDLAVLFKDALEDEFSGFVDVFVSSDGKSIPAGANFLKKIEDGLTDCIGAVYLISPISVKRNWVNFELGAAWIRNAINLKSGEGEIPTLPICHSGIIPADLPQPLNNLNAIQANKATQLEFAFRSLQIAVGGKGKLKTNFDKLAHEIKEFEKNYTIGDNLKKMLNLIGGDINKLISHCKQQPPNVSTTLDLGFLETSIIKTLKDYESNELQGLITVHTDKPGTSFRTNGAINGAKVSIVLNVSFILEFEDKLRA
jgi:hypothetical protein